jgi:hypothetical protein
LNFNLRDLVGSHHKLIYFKTEHFRNKKKGKTEDESSTKKTYFYYFQAHFDKPNNGQSRQERSAHSIRAAYDVRISCITRESVLSFY